MRDHDLFLEQALVEAGLLTNDQLDVIHTHASEHKVDLSDALTQTKMLSDREIAMVKADLCEVPYVDLNDYDPSFENTRLLPKDFAERYRAFPLFLIDGVLTLAMDDPLNLEAADQARQICRLEVDAIQAERATLIALIARAYSLGRFEKKIDESEVARKLEEKKQTDEKPVVSAVNQLLHDAAEQNASDIHINPDETRLHLRYRVDGVLIEKQGPPLSMHTSIVQRLKVMGRLDLTQTKRPQDGKFRFECNGTQIDIRLSCLPTVCGENVVMRLLKSTQSIYDFEELGVPGPLISEIESALSQPYGMLLVTGPTGSGKTTTLYTALSKLNDPSRNLMTIENPVEIRLPYIRQIQTHEEIGLTFASALRSILRQDPDVILVGEIRDEETARIALQASLTGHMVLSTLHTNDAAGAVDRLRDFGIQPFVINSALLGVLAQRLVRRVCEKCTTPDTLDELTRSRFSLAKEERGFVRGKGCSRCGHTGYRGRLGLYEYLPMSYAVRKVVEGDGSLEKIRQIAVTQGMRLMWQDGLDKARLGRTTLSEVARAASIIDLQDPNLERQSA